MTPPNAVHIRRRSFAVAATILAALAFAGPAHADQAPPAAPAGLTWNGTTVSWDDPQEGGTPIARVHWEFCRNWSGVAPQCLTGEGPVEPFPLTDSMVPLDPPPTACIGVWSKLRVWFADASGNADPVNNAASLGWGATPMCQPPGLPEVPHESDAPPTPAPPTVTRVKSDLTVGGRLTAKGKGSERRKLLSITVTAKPGEAGGTVRLRVTGKQGKRTLTRTRSVRIANGRASFTLTVPKGFRHLKVKATYAGSETHAPSSRTVTVRIP